MIITATHLIVLLIIIVFHLNCNFFIKRLSQRGFQNLYQCIFKFLMLQCWYHGLPTKPIRLGAGIIDGRCNYLSKPSD